MARKFLDNLDLNRNQLLNAIVQVLAAAPSTPVAGQVYYDSTLATMRVWNGSAWVNLDATQRTGIPFANLASPTAPFDFGGQRLTDLATPTSTTDAATKSYVDTKTLDTFAPPAAALSIAGQKLTNVATPTASSDGATKGYVDGAVQSSAAGIAAKPSVVAVATSNIASLSGTSTTIDGVTLQAGYRVLLTAQSTASQNGPWVVQSGAWTRPTSDANNELETGALWFVEQGTSYGATQWWLNSPTAGNAITPGTTAISVVQFAAAASYTASKGVTKVGNDFEGVAAAGGGLTVGASGFAVDTTVVSRKYSATIGDGSSTSIVVTHNLGTLDVIVQVYDSASAPANLVECSVQRTTTNSVTLAFSSAPAASSLRVTILG